MPVRGGCRRQPLARNVPASTLASVSPELWPSAAWQVALYLPPCLVTGHRPMERGRGLKREEQATCQPSLLRQLMKAVSPPGGQQRVGLGQTVTLTNVPTSLCFSVSALSWVGPLPELPNSPPVKSGRSPMCCQGRGWAFPQQVPALPAGEHHSAAPAGSLFHHTDTPTRKEFAFSSAPHLHG